MPEAYGDAALRHWTDACLLEQNERLPNADQLCGLAAECAIKVAVSQLPSGSDGGKLTKLYREHVDVLWDRALTLSLGKRFPTLLTVLKSGRPFNDWSVGQRYEPDDAVGPEAARRHREAAKRLMGAMSLLGTRRRN